MQDVKKIMLAAFLVLCLAGAPAALAQDGASPFAGLFAPFAEWLERLLGIHDPSAAEGAACGDPAEIMGYTVPGG